MNLRLPLIQLVFFFSLLQNFGPIGFNMMYPFSAQDLTASSVVLSNYMESVSGSLPWEDLRYLFGEIMYGGHIVNDMDRLLCNTYLQHFLRSEMLEEMDLVPFADDRSVVFQSPPPISYSGYLDHIETLPGESPTLFGLHHNAEIGFRTQQANNLFRTIDLIQPQGAGDEDGAGGEASPQNVAEIALQDLLDVYREITFDIADTRNSISESGPFQNVFLQECEAMNRLLAEIVRSLSELELGFRGDLTVSSSMETLMHELYMGDVPSSWAKLAFPSLRPLTGWSASLQLRISQLQDWCANPDEIAPSVWLTGLFNPSSFLTAIRQETSQSNGTELDKLEILTDVTKRRAAEIGERARDGEYIHGLFMEGAQWDIGSTCIVPSKPKEMFCPMPVITCKAVLREKVLNLDGKASGIYRCPVYVTQQRGPTFV